MQEVDQGDTAWALTWPAAVVSHDHHVHCSCADDVASPWQPIGGFPPRWLCSAPCSEPPPAVEAWSGEPCKRHPRMTSTWQMKQVRRQSCPHGVFLPTSELTLASRTTGGEERGSMRGEGGRCGWRCGCPRSFTGFVVVVLVHLVLIHLVLVLDEDQHLVLQPSNRGRHR